MNIAPKMPRVRFAPSPTGYLHIGGARTALFNWLYARHHNGTFVLRIEDTDTARNSQQAVDVILKGLKWLGLDWDEGPAADDSGSVTGNYGPYFQSQRTANYQAHVAKLLSEGKAYEQDGAVKFKMSKAPVTIKDLVIGNVVRKLSDREAENPDFVIMRSDGQPVFHLVNVVDDMEMEISHVIRGEDHLSNTSKHLALFEALGAPAPQYAHIPLILNPDGTKMSKSNKGAALDSYITGGFQPETVINFLSLMGWSPKNNREKISLEETIQSFDLPQILRHNAKFDYSKLLWLQGEYNKELPLEKFRTLAAGGLTRAGINLGDFSDAYVKEALDTCIGKVKAFAEMEQYAGFYFRPVTQYDEEGAKEFFNAESKALLGSLNKNLLKVDDFKAANLEATLKQTAAELTVKPARLIHPCRLALTGNKNGPSLYHLMQILGKDAVSQRLEQTMALPAMQETHPTLN